MTPHITLHTLNVFLSNKRTTNSTYPKWVGFHFAFVNYFRKSSKVFYDNNVCALNVSSLFRALFQPSGAAGISQTVPQTSVRGWKTTVRFTTVPGGGNIHIFASTPSRKHHTHKD